MMNTITCGDCLTLFAKVVSESVNLIITSPPYFLNKEYEKTTTWDQHCSMMRGFFMNAHRVLRPGGYIVVNFGDYFNSGNRFYDADVPSVQPASLSMYEWGMSQEFDLQATRIWRKQFAKMGIPFVCNHHPRNIFDYEHVWTFRKRNGDNKEVVYDRKLSQRGVLGESWTSVAGIAAHCAAFPVELPTWAIQCYTAPGATVLDPFAGSGTVGVACQILGRNFILFELSAVYCELALTRLNQ